MKKPSVLNLKVGIFIITRIVIYMLTENYYCKYILVECWELFKSILYRIYLMIWISLLLLYYRWCFHEYTQQCTVYEVYGLTKIVSSPSLSVLMSIGVSSSSNVLANFEIIKRILFYKRFSIKASVAAIRSWRYDLQWNFSVSELSKRRQY